MLCCVVLVLCWLPCCLFLWLTAYVLLQGINDLAFGYQHKCCLVLLHGAADRIRTCAGKAPWISNPGHATQPFRELMNPNSKFQWSQSLEDAFQHSKSVIVDLVNEGITTSDINRKTCLAQDWSKQGMGFLLLQKYCDCPDDKAPTCCPDGWRLVFAGSKVCTSAESRYAPIEGEASAITWSDVCAWLSRSDRNDWPWATQGHLRRSWPQQSR